MFSGNSAIDVLADLPWTQWRRLVHWVRRRVPKAWPEERSTIVVDISHEDLRERLYAARWETTPYALRYEGEVVNMRRPAGRDDQGREREVHVRSRDHEAGIELECHEEASRYTAKKAHLSEPVNSLGRVRALAVLPVESSELVGEATDE